MPDNSTNNFLYYGVSLDNFFESRWSVSPPFNECNLVDYYDDESIEYLNDLYAEGFSWFPWEHADCFKTAGGNCNAAPKGTRPTPGNNFCTLTGGVSTIHRVDDNTLQIGSATYTGSQFRCGIVPKVLAVLLVGGGGGGGGGWTGNAYGSGSGGGGGGLALALLDLSQGDTYTVTVGARGDAGEAASHGSDGSASTITSDLHSGELTAGGGRSGQTCASKTVTAVGGAGGTVSNTCSTIHLVASQTGGAGGHSCAGFTVAVKGGDMSLSGNMGLGESVCGLSRSVTAEWRTESDLSGVGGGGGCSYVAGQKGIRNGDSGAMDIDANPGTRGAGGPGGKRKPALGSAGPGHHGGGGICYIFY